MRIALGVEYDGTPYSGWQLQVGVPSVQACVEEALAAVATHPVRVICAGHTDTGVHATGQVIHFDSDVVREERAWVFGTNANLPKSVAILWAKPVDDEFHARFCAFRRRYRYVIFNRPTRPTFMAYKVSWACRSLDVERMAQAATYLVGEHDFSAYRALGCQAKSPVKSIYALSVTREGSYLYIDIEANAFLHHMVRNIAGVLMAIGAGERPPEWAKEVLDQQDRTRGGVTAPPHGLYLIGVDYPEKFNIPPTLPTAMPW